MKKNNLSFGMVNESRDYIKKLGQFELKPQFAYAFNLCPHHLRQCKYYQGLYAVFLNGVRVHIDCNHSEIVNEVEIPKIICGLKDMQGEVIVLKRFFADKVREWLVKNAKKNKAVVKPKVAIEEVIKVGLIEDLKKKHAEAKPGRDLWDYEADKGVPRVFKVQDKREIETKLGMSPIFDIVDVETTEELSVWGLARLVNAFEAEGVYVVEYNGKSVMENGLEAHSFFITDVTAEYAIGIKKGKK